MADIAVDSASARPTYLRDQRVREAWSLLYVEVNECHPSLLGLLDEMQRHYYGRLDLERRLGSSPPQ